MDMDKNLAALKKIRPVNAPPFLFTRIMSRINDSAVSPTWRWSAAAGFAILIMLNIYVVSRQPVTRAQSGNIETVVSGMSLSNSNNLYDE